MGLDPENIDGQTHLDEDEKEGLLIPAIATREELDEFEQQNIEEAMQWVLGRKAKPETILTEKFVCNLHKRMYGEVWAWAGKFRKTDKNLGIDKWQIPTALQALCDDTLFWFQNIVLNRYEGRRVYFSGSLHTLWNFGAHNANQFNEGAFDEVIARLEKLKNLLF
ncbi:MAG: hypothetical protein LC670_09150 [Flavobacteriales bacterium]|nr:hypothetical protein [Flavobacteriales bacterium]